MNDWYDLFINNKLWIHIESENVYMLKDLCEIMSKNNDWNEIINDTFQSIAERLKKDTQLWLRHYKTMIYYVGVHPRSKLAPRALSPWIYDNGEIIEIKDFVKLDQILIEENELLQLWGD